MASEHAMITGGEAPYFYGPGEISQSRRAWLKRPDPTVEYSYYNAATCPDCGQGMVRLGRCFSCPVCGFSSCEI